MLVLWQKKKKTKKKKKGDNKTGTEFALGMNKRR